MILWIDIVSAAIAFGGMVFVYRLCRRRQLITCYCVDCGLYVGLYETSLRYVAGKPVVHQEPRFSQGLCFWKGRLIKDGFRKRKCKYFEQLRENWPQTQYIPLVGKRLRRQESLIDIFLIISTMGISIAAAIIMIILTDLGLIPPVV